MGETSHLIQKEFKLHAVLVGIIRDLEDNERYRPWEYEGANKRALVERKIRRLKVVLTQLESLAPWTVGREVSGPIPLRNDRQQFIDRHFQYVENPFLPYPSSDSSSDDE